MKKSMAFVLIGLLAISVAAVAWASPKGLGFMGGHGPGMGGPMNPAAMTDEQKTDWKAYHDKMVDAKKEFLQQQVARGTITQDQADLQIKWMQYRFEQRMNGRPALTDEQKAEFKAYHAKMIALKKEFLQQQVAKGAMTQEQADKQLKWMQHDGARGHGHGDKKPCDNSEQK